jgi:hypothetical protein
MPLFFPSGVGLGFDVISKQRNADHHVERTEDKIPKIKNIGIPFLLGVIVCHPQVKEHGGGVKQHSRIIPKNTLPYNIDLYRIKQHLPEQD